MAPTPTEKSKNNMKTQKCHQNFEYTTIADRLRTVIWSYESHPSGVVKPVNGIQILPLTTTVFWSRERTSRYYLTVSRNFKLYSLQRKWYWKDIVSWISALLKGRKTYCINFYLNILKQCAVWLHSSCGTDLGQSCTITTTSIQLVLLNRFTGSQPSR